MEQAYIDQLIEKYLESRATAAEQQELLDWYHAQNEAEVLWISSNSNEEAEVRERLLARINAVTQSKARKLWPRIHIAAGIAAAVATIVFGVWFFSTPGSVDSSLRAQRGHLNDVAPGHSGATITYSTGEVIQLDSTKTGVTIDPTSLTYNDGSVISSATRDISQGRDDGKAPLMTASTAKGQTYIFTLPDGSKVWLNAATTLKFPSTFAHAQNRIVEVSGEAYFEVFSNKSQPFVVKTKKLGNIPEQEITVLGTHFNVNSYADEGRVATTLLEGSVSISSSSARHPGAGRDLAHEAILKPGEQALNTENTLKVTQIDPESAIAWRSGVLVFDSAPLSEVMRQVARWYDVEVVYEQQSLKDLIIEGSASKYDKVSRILKTLENIGAVKFKIVGRKIIVSE